MLLKSRGTLLVILDTLFDVELLLDDEEAVFLDIILNVMVPFE